MNSAIRSFLCLLTTGCLLFITAAPPSIGMVKSSGDFQIDGAAVRGNATLFEGSTVQTGATSSKIQLSDGSQIWLDPGSKVRVYSDRTVLQQGAQRIQNSPKHPIEVATLQVLPANTSTVAEIVSKDNTHVSIAAREGSLDVRNGAGVLVATVRPGLALAFDAQAGASTASKIGGCLVKKGDKYLLTDATTKVTVELQGPGVANSAGHQVVITGSMIPDTTPAPGATQVIQVVSVDSVGAACKGVPAGAVAAGVAAGGLSTAAIVAIVGGVAVVASTVGLAASGTFSGNSVKPVSAP